MSGPIKKPFAGRSKVSAAEPTFHEKTLLATFPSASRPGKTHSVFLSKHGSIYCECESWKIQHNNPQERHCGHTLKFLERATHAGIPLNKQETAILPATVRPTRKPKEPEDELAMLLARIPITLPTETRVEVLKLLLEAKP